MKEFIEKLIGRLEDELKTAREMQTTQCIEHDGYGTPLQSKLSGEICALLKVQNIVKQLAEEYNNGWIPCSVRIPTEQERWFGYDLTDAEPREFIVMVKGAYEPTTGYYHSGYGCWVKDLTSEYDDKNTGYWNEVVACRFFPQPYQTNGE